MMQTKTWIRIAPCSDIPLREGRSAKIGEHEIAIFNLGERFLAVENHCPHKGGPLADGIVSGASIVCPLHAWKFCLETGEGASKVSAGSCVQTYRTRVCNGIVSIEWKEARGETRDPDDQDLPLICTSQSGSTINDVALGD